MGTQESPLTTCWVSNFVLVVSFEWFLTLVDVRPPSVVAAFYNLMSNRASKGQVDSHRGLKIINAVNNFSFVLSNEIEGVSDWSWQMTIDFFQAHEENKFLAG